MDNISPFPGQEGDVFTELLAKDGLIDENGVVAEEGYYKLIRVTTDELDREDLIRYAAFMMHTIQAHEKELCMVK